MGKRGRLTLQYTSDDDDGGDNAAPEAPKTTRPTAPGSPCRKKQQRRRADDDEADLELVEEGKDENDLEEMRRDEEEEERREDALSRHRRGRKPERPAEESDEELEEKKAEAEEGEDEEDGADAVPIGDPVEVTGNGNTQRKHYASFEYEGNTYELGDSVMFRPEQENEKPYVGIIKDINENDGSLSVTAQWFYRPEEAEQEGGDPRELFYSFHIDDVSAESVMHTCMVHFIPQHKQIPSQKEHPGFIVQQVYDHIEEKLWNLADKDYKDDKQHEIDLLVQKTLDRIGELPDRDPEDIPGDNTYNFSKRRRWKRAVNPKDVSTDAPTGKSEQFMKTETPGNDNLKNYAILVRNKAVTGEQSRDRWLDKFVDTILASKVSVGAPHADPGSAAKSLTNGSAANDTSSIDNEDSYPPDLVVSIVASLERSTFEALCADFQKYNQKMRTFEFNIKKSSILRRRLMNKELDPPALLTMSPDELKAGLKPAEKISETEESRQLQMTGVQCKICTEKKVGITDIIHANRGDRYQLECTSCGCTWYSSRDEVALTSS